MITNLKDYTEFVKAIANCTPVIDGDHILATRGTTSDFKLAFAKLLELENDGKVIAKVKRNCKYAKCINPEHYTVSFETKQDMTPEEKEELNILMDDIDFDRLGEIGTERYLEEYNDGLPEELKISLKLLKLCVKIHG